MVSSKAREGSVFFSALLRRLGGLLSASLVAAGASAVAGVLIARSLGPSGHGIYTTVVAASSFTLLVLTLGTGISLRIKSKGSPSSADLASFNLFSALAAPIAGGVCLVVSFASVPVSGLVLATIIFVYGALAFTVRQKTDLLQVFGKVSSAQVGSAIAGGVTAACAGVLMAADYGAVEAALCAVLCGQLAQLVFVTVLIRSSQKNIGRGPASLRRAAELVRAGYPNVGYGVGLFALQRFDRLAIAWMIDPRAVGIYAAAASLAELSRVLTGAVGQFLFVTVSRTGSITREANLAYTLGVIVQILVCASLVAGAGFLVPLLYGSDFSDSITILRVLLAAEIFMGLSLMDSRIAIARGRVRLVSAGTIAIGLVSVPTYLAVAQLAGGREVALACVSVYFILAAFSAATARVNRTII